MDANGRMLEDSNGRNQKGGATRVLIGSTPLGSTRQRKQGGFHPEENCNVKKDE